MSETFLSCSATGQGSEWITEGVLALRVMEQQDQSATVVLDWPGQTFTVWLTMTSGRWAVDSYAMPGSFTRRDLVTTQRNAWLYELLAAKPEWRTDGERVTLSTDTRTVEFRSDR